MSKAAELANLIGNINAGGGGVNRNVIINGAMNVAQRGTSTTGLGADGTSYNTVDRFQFTASGTAGRFTMSQDSSAPSGFANSLKFDCTTADTSIAAGELLILSQLIEGQNVQHFAKGTSDAKPFAVSFYVKGNASATYVAELYDGDNNRCVSKTFSVTTDWTRIELSMGADTTGAFDDDNAVSLYFNIWLHGGSTFTGGTLNTSWNSVTQANRAVGISSFFDSTDRTFFLTGVQVEAGQNPTAFEHEPFNVTLEKCQRYFQSNDVGALTVSIVRDSDDIKRGTLFYPTRMRSDGPSVTLSNTTLDGGGLSVDEARDTGVAITMSSGSDGNVPKVHIYTVEDEL
jgi:hypothetical protein